MLVRWAQAGGAGTIIPGLASSLTPRMGGVLTGTVAYTDSTGAVWPFVYTGSVTATAPYTAYTVPAGQPWQLATSPTGTTGYTLTDVLTGEAWRFDAQGRSLSDTDSYGNQNSLTQAASGPTSEANSGGRSLAFSYQSGQLADAQSPLWQSGGAGAAGSQHVTYGYNPSGQFTTRTQGAGTSDAVTTTFGYSGTLLTSITTGANRTWALGYDPSGRVASVTSPVSGTAGQAGYTPAYTTQFSYLPGQTQVVQGFGATDATTTTYSFDGQGQATAVTDALGHATQTSYDQDHDAISITDANGHITTNAYAYVGTTGSVGLITQTVAPAIAPYVPGNAASMPVVTTRRYEPQTFDLLEIDRPEGGITLLGYDGHHSVITTTDTINPTDCDPIPCSHQWRGRIYTYDPHGERTAITDGRGVSVTGAGAASLTANAAGYTRHMGYDAQGDLASEGTPPITTTLNGITTTAPTTTSYGFDGDGNQTSLTSPNGQTTTDSYDHLGRQVRITRPTVPLYSGGTTAPVETTSYDGDGNITQQTDANGDVTAMSYDPMARMVSVMNPVSGTTIITYSATHIAAEQDALGNVTRYLYDQAGRRVQAIDAANGTTSYAYDAAGNTTAITATGPSGVVSAEARGYDAENRVVTDTISGPGFSPQTTLTAYDLDGNVTQIQQPNGDVTYNTYDTADQLLGTLVDANLLSRASAASHPTYESYGYDAAGNQTTSSDADGRTTSTVFDGDDRTIQTVAMTGSATITTTTQYDPDGNTLSQTTSSTGPNGAETHTSADGFDATGRESSANDDGLQTSYGYDAAGQQRVETIMGSWPVTSTLDPAGRTTAISEGVGGTAVYDSTFGYNPDDLPITVTLPGSIQENMGYDRAARLTHLGLTGPGSAAVTTTLSTTYDYGYDPATGWTTSVITNANGVSGTETITHDAQGRITGDTRPTEGTETWGYDKNGNITTNTELIEGQVRTTTYTYSTDLPISPTIPNELTSQHTDGFGTEYFQYDGHGNTISITSTDPMTDSHYINTHLSYDSLSRLTRATLKNNESVAMGYNADGLRSSYTVTDSTGLVTTYHFEYRNGELGQVAVTGTQTYTDTYLYNPGAQPLELLRQYPGQPVQRYWYVLDGWGSVIALTDANGTVVDRYSYDVWGEPERVSETIPQRLRYRGYWYDAKLGWYWLTTRSYDPEGRFLQPDPSQIDGIRTYSYVNDDPADYADPLGLDWETDAFGTCNAPWDWVLNPNGCAARQAVDDFKRFINPKTAWWEKVLIVVSYAPIPVGRAARIGLVARLVFREGWSIRLSDRAFAVLSRFVRVARFDAALSGCVTRCFPAGTLVAMPGGARPIQSLHVGDTVLAEDPATGKVEPEPVQAVTSDPPSPLIGIALSDASTITATVDHLFWVDASAKQRVGGWLRADELRPGDHLRTATGGTVAVTGLHRHAGRAVVYTLTVARDHTFFVGTARVLVHNAPGGLSLCLIIPRIGDTWGGPGAWGLVNRGTRGPATRQAANYQEYVSGVERAYDYFVDGIKFDGYDPNRRVLLEAKDHYEQFIGKPWFDWKAQFVEVAERQLSVLPAGYTIEWHFSEQATLNEVQGILAQNAGQLPGVQNIHLVFDPRPWH